MQAHQLRLLAVLATLSLTGVSYRPTPSAFVTTYHGQLLRDGKPFRFVGVNCYRLIECTDRADGIFATLHQHGVRVVRFWAFPHQTADLTNFDKLIAAAKRHEILLLPVLENHWPDCNGADSVKSRDWYAKGWKGSYASYLHAVGARYRDEAQILAWQLINEPEIYPDTEENFAALQTFAREAARELRRADSHHLVSLGLLGLGQPSTTGRRFPALHAKADLVSAHDYGYMDEPLAGRDWPKRENNFYADLCDARSLRKPFVATEAGIALAWVSQDRDLRARQFQAKLDAFFAAGGSGYILWNFEPWPDTDYGFNEADPVMKVIAKVSARL